MDASNRRSFLKSIGSAGALSVFPEVAFGGSSHESSVIHEIVQPAQDANATPKYTIKFAVCGMSHDYIYGMVSAIQNGGGILIAAYGSEPDKLARFRKRYPDVKMVSSEEEIINDRSIQLVLSSKIASERAPLGVKVMKAGKDFLSDKPGITTLKQLS